MVKEVLKTDESSLSKDSRIIFFKYRPETAIAFIPKLSAYFKVNA